MELINNPNNTVSLVITSCDRFDLLEKTLYSFFKFNTYKLSQIVIIEDSGYDKKLQKCLMNFPDYEFEVIVNKEKLGQLKSIDKAYSKVTSEYIFHCEDDWEFSKSGFIEKSLQILLENKNILSVWLRDINEYNNISFSSQTYSTNKNISYMLVYDDILSFNPTLKRMSDYKIISNYARFESLNFEAQISIFYKEQNFTSAILTSSHVKHLGWHRRVANIHKNKTKLGYYLDNLIKKIKANIYKKLSIGKFKKYNP